MGRVNIRRKEPSCAVYNPARSTRPRLPFGPGRQPSDGTPVAGPPLQASKQRKEPVPVSLRKRRPARSPASTAAAHAEGARRHDHPRRAQPALGRRRHHGVDPRRRVGEGVRLRRSLQRRGMGPHGQGGSVGRRLSHRLHQQQHNVVVVHARTPRPLLVLQTRPARTRRSEPATRPDPGAVHVSVCAQVHRCH